MELSRLKLNPNNPRFIRDEKFEKLKKSIETHPKFMKLRPIIIDNDNMILGGNMRFRALKELGYKEIPDEWVKKAEELTKEEQKAFVIKDNVGFGEWDFDILASEWESEELGDWGVNLSGEWDKEEQEDAVQSDRIDEIELADSEFIEEFNKITDKNCEYPIIPQFMENYNSFIILCTNDIDEIFIRNLFKIEDICFGNDRGLSNRRSNVITVDMIKKSLSDE